MSSLARPIAHVTPSPIAESTARLRLRAVIAALAVDVSPERGRERQDVQRALLPQRPTRRWDESGAVVVGQRNRARPPSPTLVPTSSWGSSRERGGMRAMGSAIAPSWACSPWRCARSAAATRRECGDAQVRDDSSSASRRAKQNDATAQPCPARPSRACLASRTNRVPVVTRIGGRGDGAAVDDGPGCRRRADAAALSSRGRDLGGRGPKRRVLRQADGGRAQTSLSWLADTLLSQDRAAPIRFCLPTGRRGPLRRRPPSRSCPGSARPAPWPRHSGLSSRPAEWPVSPAT